METLGHIKIGATSQGLALQTSKIKLVETGKGGSETFIPYKGQEEGSSSVHVKLPYIYNLKENFKVSEISFVLINNIHKYRAEIVGTHVYLIPYQPNLDNVMVDLPVIKLGTVKKWKQSLQMELRAIGYFIPTETGNRIFDFKTMSKFSIFEITKFLDRLSSLPASVIANLDLELVYKRKIFKTEKTDEIMYLTFAEITPQQIIEASNPIPARVMKPIESLENDRVKEFKDLIKNAISVEEAETFFGKKILISVDSMALQSFGVYTSSEDLVEKVEAISEKVEAKEADIALKEDLIEANQDALDALIEKSVPLPVAKSLILKHSENAFKVAEEMSFDIVSLVKSIAAA